MPQTYTPIATNTLSAAASSVTFSSISQQYTDLIIASSAFYSSSGGNRFATFQVGNGSVDTATNYSWIYLDNFTGAPGSGKTTSSTYGLHSFTSSISTSTSMNTIMQMQNYSNTSTNKTMLHRFNSSAITGIYVNLWRSTSAINIITISASGANFAAGSTFTLYGIKAA